MRGVCVCVGVKDGSERHHSALAKTVQRLTDTYFVSTKCFASGARPQRCVLKHVLKRGAFSLESSRPALKSSHRHRSRPN